MTTTTTTTTTTEPMMSSQEDEGGDSMDWVHTTAPSAAASRTTRTSTITRPSRSGDGDGEEVEEGTARKRIRTSSDDCDLPAVVGYHLVLVGPRHLTQPFATTLLQVSSSLDGTNSSPWMTSDADILAIQALQRTISYTTLSYSLDGTATTRKSTAACPTQQRYVHLLDRLDDDQLIPQPCHIVMLTECTPQAFTSGPIRELASVQAAIRHLISAFAEKTTNAQAPPDLEWLRHQSISLLVCLSSTVHDDEMINDTTTTTTTYHDHHLAKWILQKSGMAVFTCRHPQLESSRRTVARLLWQRCRQSLRQGGGDGDGSVGITMSPLAVARFS